MKLSPTWVPGLLYSAPASSGAPLPAVSAPAREFSPEMTSLSLYGSVLLESFLKNVPITLYYSFFFICYYTDVVVVVVQRRLDQLFIVIIILMAVSLAAYYEEVRQARQTTVKYSYICITHTRLHSVFQGSVFAH